MRIGIIVGSTRPGRKALEVANWVFKNASNRENATYEIVDIADFNLPLLDESVPPSRGQYEKEHTKKWASKIAELDGFVFVTPEYNHSTSGALKNAIDFVYGEWTNKAAGFVGYGSMGGSRAIEHLRLIMAECQVATVRSQVMLSLFTDFENFSTFKPAEMHTKSLNAMLEQLEKWTSAMRSIRN